MKVRADVPHVSAELSRFGRDDGRAWDCRVAHDNHVLGASV